MTRDASTSDTAIVVNYPVDDTTPANGGSSITSIALYWDSGSNQASWTEIIGESSDSLLTSITVSNGVTRGETYYFKAKSKNIFGSSTYSNPVGIKAAMKPD